MNNKTLHAYIQGRVQGVGFRAATLREARILGLKGWVKNLADGRVEVMASGELAVLEQLHQWLKKGPQFAAVSAIDFEFLDYKVFENFEIN